MKGLLLSTFCAFFIVSCASIGDLKSLKESIKNDIKQGQAQAVRNSQQVRFLQTNLKKIDQTVNSNSAKSDSVAQNILALETKIKELNVLVKHMKKEKGQQRGDKWGTQRPNKPKKGWGTGSSSNRDDNWGKRKNNQGKQNQTNTNNSWR
ncbi:MAG: hypothetical protein ACI86H_001834 [bacterium]|jgi:hypothetical protein